MVDESLVARRSWQTASEKEANYDVVDLVTKVEDAMPTARSTTREVGEPVDSTLGDVMLIALIGGALVLTALFIAVPANIAIAAVTVYVAVSDGRELIFSFLAGRLLLCWPSRRSGCPQPVEAVLGLLAPVGRWRSREGVIHEKAVCGREALARDPQASGPDPGRCPGLRRPQPSTILLVERLSGVRSSCARKLASAPWRRPS